MHISFRVLLLYCIYCQRQITAKYEKRGKYLPILHEARWDNYLIVKCLFKQNVSRIILRTILIGLALYNAILVQQKLQVLTLPGHVFFLTALYFHISIQMFCKSVHFFGIWWSFAINLFSNALFQTFDYFWHIPTMLSISLCSHILHQV